MRAWPVPIQIADEERIIGGVITLRQLSYNVLGLALGGASFGLLFLPLAIRIVLFLVMSFIGIAFSFMKINELRLDQYLYLYIKWRRSPKLFIADQDRGA